MGKGKKLLKTALAAALVLSMSVPGMPAVFAGESRQDYSDRAVPAEALQGDVTNGVNPFGAVPSKTGAKTARMLRAAAPLSIDSVEVVNGGDVQILYREDEITFDEASGNYYTTKRNASMTDARRFTVSVVFDNADGMIASDDPAAYDAFLETVAWTYGQKPLSDWLGGNSFSGNQFITLEEQKLEKDADGSYRLTAVILFDTPFAKTNAGTNVPYANYSAVRQSNFGSPYVLGVADTYDLAVSAIDGDTEKELGSTPIKLNLYDSFMEWSAMADYAEALKAETDAGDGYINGRYVDVTVIGYTAKNTPIWNVVIADSAASVDEYLNETKPMMENEPMKLKAALEGGDQKIPLYFNNIHPDETPGADSNVESIEMLLRNETIEYDYFDEINDVPYGDRDGYAERSGTEKTTVKYNVSDVLDKFIIVTTLTSNPDGRDKMTRVNAAGFDLNRLSAYQTQPESVTLTSDILKWNPLTMAEYHGYMPVMLIEPCTGPHDPNYEYDLLYPYMRDQAYKMGKAIIGSTPMNRFLIPAEHYRDGWDDGGPMYSPVFAMLFGILGYTIEIPYANQDNVDACNTATKALIYDCLMNRDALFANKLDYYQRGIDNADLKEIVDPYFTDPYVDPPAPVGRPRTKDELGQERSFFPEYYIIPVDEENQYNTAEAYRTMAVLERNSVKLKKTTTAVTVEGVTYPAGTYVVDMHQFTRGYINSTLSGGYDASNFETMYAEITINFPDLRGFAIKETWEKDLFTGKTEDIADFVIPATDLSGGTDYVAVKNVSQDAVKLVNRLLDNDKPVAMITEYTPEGKIGDFIVLKSDLDAFDDGLYAETTDFNADIEAVAEALVEPKIAAIGSPITPTPPQGSATPMAYVLGELGFDYTITTNGSGMRADRNVIVSDNVNYNGLADEIENGVAYIGVRDRAISAAANLENFVLGARGSTPSYTEAVIKMDILPTSPLTSAFSDAEGAYLVGSVSFGTVPDGSKRLMTVVDSDDNFVGGWWRNAGSAGYNGALLRGKTFALYGAAGAEKNVPMTLFGSNIFSKAHAQMYNPILATAIYMGAADLVDEARPYAAADLENAAAEDAVAVNLAFFAEDTVGSTAAVTEKKYKISTDARAQAFSADDPSWIDYNETIEIKAEGAFYIHWYAENDNGADSQGSFGPYLIGQMPHIGTPVFTDGKGNVVDDLSSETLAVAMDYQNITENPEKLTMIVAVYTPDHKLQAVDSDAQEIAAGQKAAFEAAVALPENTDGYYAQVFFWDTGTLAPVIPQVIFE